MGRCQCRRGCLGRKFRRALRRLDGIGSLRAEAPNSGNVPPMTGLVSKQPKSYRWAAIVGPSILACIFVWVEVRSFSNNGFDGLPTLAGWAFLTVCLATVMSPLWLVPGTITTDAEGITALYLTRKSRRLSWEDIDWISIVGVDNAPHQGYRTIQIRPRRGLRILLSDRMSNFDQFAFLLSNRAGLRINRKQGLLWRQRGNQK